MPKRGPKPKLKPFDPSAIRGRPRAPRGLGKAERVAWNEFSDVLQERGVLTRGDGVFVEMLACTLVSWRASIRAEAEAGPTTESGSVLGFKESPEAAAAGRKTRALLTLLIEGGLTPRSRGDVWSGSGAAASQPGGSLRGQWAEILNRRIP